jgi:fructose-1,6-bisphosphatase/inositol monophosphatase family enzyme
LASVDIDRVGEILREVAAAEIVPLFRNLADHQVAYKDENRSDTVTHADLAAERELTRRLEDLLPGSVTVGEEAVHDAPDLLDRLTGEAPVWVIDPVDGTNNFSQGSDVFASMVALVQGGRTVAGWILSPVSGELALAEEGSGARLDQADGRSAALVAPPPKAIGAMTSAIHVRFVTPEARAYLREKMALFAGNNEYYCAGQTYLALAKAEVDLALFGRTKPWDHAMGTLIVTEAGGRTAFADGEPYTPRAEGHAALLSTSNRENWTPVHEALFPDGWPPKL